MGNESSSPQNAEEFIDSIEHKLDEIRSSGISVSPTSAEEVASQDNGLDGTDTSIVLSESDATYVDEEQSQEAGDVGISLSPKVEVMETSDAKMNETDTSDHYDKYVPYPARETKKRLSKSKSVLASAHIATEKTKKKLLGMRRKHGLFHLDDPTELVALRASIQEQIDLMDKEIPNDDADYAFGVEYLRQNYDRLIRSCRNYEAFLDAQPKLFMRDKSMKKMIRQIIDQSNAEKEAFAIIRDEYISGFRYDGKKWRDVLFVIRAERLDAKDLKSEGAGTSLLKIKTNRNGSQSFIKPEERTASNDSISAYLLMYANTGDPALPELVKTIMTDSEYPDIEKSLYTMITTMGGTGDIHRWIKDAIKAYATEDVNRVMKEYLSSFLEFAYKKRTELGVSKGNLIREGSVISSRNVSTTRVADRLGVGEIIARSETVIVKQKDGTFVRANSMEGITGANTMQMQKLCKKLHGEWSNRRLKISGKAAAQLYELQVLDLICSQIDRHPGNYMAIFRFVQDPPPAPPDSGEVIIESIKGIDNDLSFGEMGSVVKSGLRFTGPIARKNLPVTVRFISKQFYDRLMTPGMERFLEFDQLDLRTPKEIQALVERFLTIKQEIKECVESGKIAVINDESEYEKKFAEIYEEVASEDSGGMYENVSYVSRILMNSRKKKHKFLELISTDER